MNSTEVFSVIVEVKALICNNPNFTPNTNAVELVAEMIEDAKMFCLRSITQVDKTDLPEDSKTSLKEYLERKYSLYESMENSLIKKPTVNMNNTSSLKKFNINRRVTHEAGDGYTRTDEVVLASDVATLEQSLKLANERLAKLSKLVWETRWVSDEQDYMDMVGIAASINSGNYEPIDAIELNKI